MKLIRALPVFSLAGAVFYAISAYVNVAWIYYYPKIGVWHLGHLPRAASNGTPSAWYGFTTQSLFGALVVAALYVLLQRPAKPPALLSWAVPVAAMVVVVYVIAKLFWL